MTPDEWTQWRKLYLDSAPSTLDATVRERETTATYRSCSKGITFLTQPRAMKRRDHRAAGGETMGIGHDEMRICFWS